jgi:hypothetical protein
MTAPDATDAQSLFLRGNALLVGGQFLEALATYTHARELRPDHPDTLANLGVACAELGRLDEALAWYDAAIRLRPRFAQAHYNRGNALSAARRYAEALAAYDEALHCDLRFARGWNNRGLALLRLGRALDALTSYREALRLLPAFPEARNNLGHALQVLGYVPEAILHFDECLRMDPNFVPAHSNRAQALLLSGDFVRGWPEYEWRLRLPALQRLASPLPLWDGSPLKGRSILLRHEQGLGDTLQFVRYAGVLQQHGARVVLECPPALRPLLQTYPGVDALVSRGDADHGCDCQAPLLSLPGLLRTDLHSIPATAPFLSVSPERIARWRARLPRTGFLIGVCWKGSSDYPEDVYRSIPLTEFAPLARTPGVQVISLQKGPGRDQIASVQEQFPLLELGDDLDAEASFLDTAAVMDSLDLVVTADTALGHLAGALGRPVWLALTVSPDWRWLIDRKDSPWYPSVRLFRQPTLGNWRAVFEEMARTLEVELHSQPSRA